MKHLNDLVKNNVQTKWTHKIRQQETNIVKNFYLIEHNILNIGCDKMECGITM